MNTDIDYKILKAKSLKRGGQYLEASLLYNEAHNMQRNSLEAYIGVHQCLRLSDPLYRKPQFDDLGILTVAWESREIFEAGWIEYLLSGINVRHVLLHESNELPPYSLIVAGNLSDPDIRRVIIHANINLYPIFLYHVSDEAYYGGYDIYSYFNWVFKNYYTDDINIRNVSFMPLGYGKGIDVHKAYANQPKSYQWGFIGDANKASRLNMLNTLSQIKPNYTHNANGFSSADAFTPALYSETMSQFKFSPSPVGNFNVECFRVWEALELGSIPIVEIKKNCNTYNNLESGAAPFYQITTWQEGANVMQFLLQNESILNQHAQELQQWWKRTKIKLRHHLEEKIINA